MENPMYSCPICHGNLLFEDMAAPPGKRPVESALTQKFYCPHCEMLVEPVITSTEERAEEGIASRDAGTENRGRSSAAGSNAGGSQRGDLSDEGATQWRTDPRETERNTWEDKP
ncbi:MAG: hypothetical protein ACRD5K_20075 [Candidatus Acidiferrales bacterium]